VMGLDDGIPTTLFADKKIDWDSNYTNYRGARMTKKESEFFNVRHQYYKYSYAHLLYIEDYKNIDTSTKLHMMKLNF
jgi:hypothetical protein